MSKKKPLPLALGAAALAALSLAPGAYAIGENACENEVSDRFPDASMADITAAPAVPMRGGALRVDWSVHTEKETARGYCKTTKGGDVVQVKVLHHKTYRQGNDNEFDGFYYDEHMGAWRDDSGEICHTCTPDNGFPAHNRNQRSSYQPKNKFERQMLDEINDRLTPDDIRALERLGE